MKNLIEVTLVYPDSKAIIFFLTVLPQINHSFIIDDKAYKVYDVIHQKIPEKKFAKIFVMLRLGPDIIGNLTFKKIESIQHD